MDDLCFTLKMIQHRMNFLPIIFLPCSRILRNEDNGKFSVWGLGLFWVTILSDLYATIALLTQDDTDRTCEVILGEHGKML